MTQVDDVAKYVRDNGADGRKITVQEVAEKLDISTAAIADARTKLMRREEDIYPAEPSVMVHMHNWKQIYPEVWVAAQERTRVQKTVQANRDQKERRHRKKNWLPNVMGPVTTINNVVAVNVHSDHVSIQHEDGSWTNLTGTLKLEEKRHG